MELNAQPMCEVCKKDHPGTIYDPSDLERHEADCPVRGYIQLIFSNDEEERQRMETVLLERIAAIQHEIWAHWMTYLFSVCHPLQGRPTSGVIPYEYVERWLRQVETPYSELPEIEKESDRDQARKVIAAL